MTEDARFEDADGGGPLRLKAQTEDDLPILSALLQDAVLPVTEMRWLRRERRFAMLVNRFRWEDARDEARGQRPFERVRSLVVVNDVMKVASQGFDRSDRDLVLSILSLGFDPGPEGTGRLEFLLAGDGGIALDVETVDLVLADVTRPYEAPSGKAPDHSE